MSGQDAAALHDDQIDSIIRARILLADDDEFVSGFMKTVLVNSGFEVILARDGKEALDLYDPVLIDLVLVDVFMPEMDGIELIRELRHANPEVRIVAITGDAQGKGMVYLSIAKQLGADAILMKPFKAPEFLEVVHGTLE